MMQAWVLLSVCATTVDMVSADYLHLMQRRAGLTHETSQTQPEPAAECAGADCDLATHPGGFARVPDRSVDAGQEEMQDASFDEVASADDASLDEDQAEMSNASFLESFLEFASADDASVDEDQAEMSNASFLELASADDASLDEDQDDAISGLEEEALDDATLFEQRFEQRVNSSRTARERVLPLHVFPLNGERYVLWRLCGAQYHSNLGGRGPQKGEKSLRYFRVATVQDATGARKDLDLVIQTQGEYQANNVRLNGLVQGDSCFGQINVKSGFRNFNSVTVFFNWYVTGTWQPVVLNKQYFTIYDVDGSKSKYGDSYEKVTFYNRVENVYQSKHTQLKREGRLQSGLSFSARGMTNNVILPVDPETLTWEQQRRAVTVSYVDRSKFKLMFTVKGGGGGRNFAFSGHSVLAPAPPPTLAPTSLPTPTPTSPPTASPTPAPTPAPTSSPSPATTPAATQPPTAAARIRPMGQTESSSPTPSPTDAPDAGPLGNIAADTPPPTAAARIRPMGQTESSSPTPSPTDEPDAGPVAAPTATPAPTLATVDHERATESAVRPPEVTVPSETSVPSESSEPLPVTTPLACKETGTCSIYEDPHINVFDGMKISLLSTKRRVISDYGSGDMWLVQSSNIRIQGRYLPNPDLPTRNLFVRAVAVGGPFLNGSTLIVGPLSEAITFNGEPILRKQNTNFITDVGNGVVGAKRHKNSHLVQDMTQIHGGVDIELPLGVKLTVNRYPKHVNVFIAMPPAAGGQDGLCGNFNCRASDDTLDMILTRRSQKVHPRESLFLEPVPAQRA